MRRIQRYRSELADDRKAKRMAGFSVIAFLIGLAVALSGCGACPTDDSSPSGADLDEDGWTAEGGDCNDADPLVHPGGPDPSDGWDNDCDGAIDEGGADSDGDGYENGYESGTGCDACDASVHPFAAETCGDEIDNNCNGAIDEGCDGGSEWDECDSIPTSLRVKLWARSFFSADKVMEEGCEDDGTSQVTATPTPEEDTEIASPTTPEPTVIPTTETPQPTATPTPEPTQPPTPCPDEDGDGYDNCDMGEPGDDGQQADCFPTEESVHPGAEEFACDGIDQDCDGSDGPVAGLYLDADEDGYGTGEILYVGCVVPGTSSRNDDCDDTDPTANPGATEVCDGVDNDCDEQIDEGYDADSDGYTVCGGDCNDVNSGINPGKTETTCNGVNDDCNTATDDSPDADSDGYDICAIGVIGADVRVIDCNDTNASVNPGATEVCDGVDNDCDGMVDGSDAADEGTFYEDLDSDGYGTTESMTQACSMPSGYAAQPGDCDDADASVSPAATETCNYEDDDCDASVDEGVQLTLYVDGDFDKFGNPASPTKTCYYNSYLVANNTDCDDSNGLVYPGAEEICDGMDNDCDDSTQEEIITTLYFTGGGDRVEVADDPSLNQGMQFTWEAWVYWAGSGSLLFSKWSESEDWGCGVNGASQSIQCSFMTMDGNYVYINGGASSMPVGVWTHVAFVYDGSDWEEVRLFIGGVLIGSKPESRTPANDDAAFLIGASIRSGETIPSFMGYMREMQISDVPLYRTNFTPVFYKASGSGTLSLPLDEGEGTTVYDLSEYENDGMVIGPYWTTSSCPSDTASAP